MNPFSPALLPRLLFLTLTAPLLATAAAKVTYDEHVLPIFEQSCLNCHNPDKAKGGLDLSSYQGTLKGGSGGKIVEPGDPSSKLLAVVMQTAEPKMPPEGDPIPADKTEVLRQWIEGGLLQNPDSKARKPSKPKFDTSLSGDPQKRPDGPPPMPRDVILEPAVVAERSSAVHAMAASRWAPVLAVTGQRQVLLYDTRDLSLVGILPFPEGDPVSLSITPDGRYLIVGGGVPGKSGVTISFDLTSGERVLTAGREFDSILCADLRPDLGAVATGSPSRLIKLWNPADGSQTASIKKHTDWVTALDYSPDGILLATGDRNGGVWVWEARTGAEFHTLRAHQAGITTASFRSDSNLLASASEDGTVRFWEMNGGKEVRKLDAHREGVLAFCWAPDGRFATAGRDRKVRVWKADFNPERAIENLPDIPTSIAIDSTSTRLFIADYRGRIHVHRIDNGEKLGELDNDPAPIAHHRNRIAGEIADLIDTLARTGQARDEATRRVEEARQALEAHDRRTGDEKQALEVARGEESGAVAEEAKRNREVEQLRQQVTAGQEDLAPMRARRDSLRQETGELGKQISAEEQSLETDRQALATASDPKADAVAQLRGTIEQRESRLEKLRSDQRQRTDEVAKLEQQIQTAQTDLEKRRQELKTREAGLRETRGTLKELRQRLKTSRERLATLEKQRPTLAAAVEEQKQSLASASADHAKAISARARLEQQGRRWYRASLNAGIHDLRKRGREIDASARDAETSFRETARMLESLSRELAEKRAELRALLEDPLPEDPEIARERDAMAAMLRDQIADLLDQLDARSADLSEQREALDRLLPEADRLHRRTEVLTRLYHSGAGTGS